MTFSREGMLCIQIIIGVCRVALLNDVNSRHHLPQDALASPKIDNLKKALHLA